MTRPEAIDVIKSIIRAHKIMKLKKTMLSDAFIDKKIEALQMALESLKIDELYEFEYESTKEAKDDQTVNSNPGI